MKKMIIKPYLCFLICIFFGCTCLGQGLNYIQYNTSNSRLPHDIIYQVNQMSTGSLLICTEDGLMSFDGIKMKRISDPLVSKYVIATDEEHGKTWIATWKSGVHILENGRTREVNSLTPYSTVSTNKILVLDDLVILHIFESYNVFRYDSSANLLTPYQLRLAPLPAGHAFDFSVNPEDKEHYRFLKTRSHRLFAYNRQGIYEVSGARLFACSAAFVPDELWESSSGKMYYRKGQNIYCTDEYFSFSELLYTIPAHLFSSYQFSEFRVLPSGNICLSFKKPDSSVTCFLMNRITGEVIDLAKEVKTSSVLSGVQVDREGGMWMGTDGDGLFHIFDKVCQQIGAGKQLKNAHISSLYRHRDGTLYIGTKKGIYMYRNNLLIPYTGFGTHSDVFVKRFVSMDGSDVNVTLKQVSEMNSYRLFEKTAVLLKDQERKERIAIGKYVVTAYDGHYELSDRSTGECITRANNMRTYMMDVAIDGEDNIWLGSANGLYRLDRVKGLERVARLGTTAVNRLLYQRGRGLWIGTNNGLYLLSGKELRYWGIAEGLSNLNISSLYLQTPGSLWIGTQNGLCNLREGELFVFKKRNGLIADDVTCFEVLPDGRMVVGSSKGITFFRMGENMQLQEAPRLEMEEIEVNGERIAAGSPLRVPYTGSISVTWSAASFVYPEYMVFEYRMNDNEKWIETQNRSLVFTNLEPGDYHVLVRAKKYNSNYSNVLEINFSIVPPWWRTWYAIAVYVIILTLAVYLFLNRRLRKREEAHRLRRELSELKMKALQAQLNPHFISNTLNTIQYFNLNHDELKANEYLTCFADLTRLLLETSRRSFISLANELEIVTLYANLEKLRFEDKFDYTIHVHRDIDPARVLIPGMLLQPFVENSVNHGFAYLNAEKKGYLEINVSPLKEGIYITIDDNGIGRTRAREIKDRSHKVYSSVSTQIVGEIKNTINELPGSRIDIEMTDKMDELNQPAGTRVAISIYMHPSVIRHDQMLNISL